MQRDPQSLAKESFDVLIIGGGISGACIAWDSALRGLKVALVEKGDFGHSTSANSMKVIHGGLRDLQSGNLRLVRALKRERGVFMRIAPHLVHPLPFLMATRGYGLHSKEALGLATATYNHIGASADPNGDPLRALPKARMIGRAECEQLAPGLPVNGVTGGAVWYDAQVENTERLTLEFALSASSRGASVANYIEAREILRRGNRVVGAKLIDLLEGSEFEVGARVVVIAAGAAFAAPLSGIDVSRVIGPDQLALAVNLVTRQVLPEYGLGLRMHGSRANGGSSPTGPSTAFVVPWRDRSIIGTYLLPAEDLIHMEGNLQQTIDRILRDINQAYPPAQLRDTDIFHVHKGLVPVVSNRRGDLELVRKTRVVDHRRADRIEGLVSVVGMKYTTARLIARQVVDVVFDMIGQHPPESRTHSEPLVGGHFERLDRFLEQAIASKPDELSKASAENIVRSYGSEYPGLYETVSADAMAASPLRGQERVIRAQVLRALQDEMAIKLSDVVMRRTDLGSAGDPGGEALQDCADLVAAEAGWSDARSAAELQLVQENFLQSRHFAHT